MNYTNLEIIESVGKEIVLEMCNEKRKELSERILNLAKLREEYINYLQKCTKEHLVGKEYTTKEWQIIWALIYKLEGENLKVKGIGSEVLELNLELEKAQVELKNIEHTRKLCLSGELDEIELDIETAKEVKIEDLYHGELKKLGSRLIGLCPIHKEKSPSFNIYTADNSYHCFGCGKGGDVLDYVQETESINFKDAIKFLCR